MLKSHLVASVLLLALPATVHAQVQVFAGNDARTNTRVFYYSQNDQGFQTHGQLGITYGSAAWKKEYESAEMMSKVRGQRWRFGTGAWTQLDTNVALEVGGQQVAPGQYYLVLELTDDDQVNLVLLDPAVIRKKKQDAFEADQTTGGISVPLAWNKEAEKADTLAIVLTAAEDDPTQVVFSVHWGPHELTVDIQAKVGDGA